jgi:hypothetical protein
MISSRYGRAIYTIPAWLDVQAPRKGTKANLTENLREKARQKGPFSLIISCLSHALFALLQRNIIAFNAPEYDYFPGMRVAGKSAGPNERERKSLCLPILSI